MKNISSVNICHHSAHIKRSLYRNISTSIARRNMQESTRLVNVEKVNHLRILTLNRPTKLNALNSEMIDLLNAHFTEAEGSTLAKIILLKGAGDRAFCAGGDIVSVAKKVSEEADVEAAMEFFRKEYTLDYRIALASKPVVTFMNGYTMGGGAGLCMHAPFRVATEKTVFSMPETAIGFFPDVGSTFFFSFLDGGLGTFLALTGHQVKGYEAFKLGIATHYVPSTMLDALELQLSNIETSDKNRIQNCIESFCRKPIHYEPDLCRTSIRDMIDDCFQLRFTLPEIYDKLENHHEPYAQTVFKDMKAKSQQSVFLALQMLKAIRQDNTLRSSLLLDFIAATNIIESEDFESGVISKLVKKEQPIWQEKTMTHRDIQMLLTRNKEIQNLDLNDMPTPIDAYLKTYNAYALPSEYQIEKYVRGYSSSSDYALTKKEVIYHFNELYNYKLGVTEKVSETLDRNCKAQPNLDDASKEYLKWTSQPKL